MPIFSTELFEIRVRQEYLGQEMINVYYYTEDDAGSGVSPASVCSVFNSTVQRDVEAIQQDQVVGIDIRCRKFGGINETIVDISAQSGVRTGPAMASFNAWGFILNRETIDIRNGAKRYGGVSETDTEGNNPAAIIVDELNTLADTLSMLLDVGGGDDIAPVIFRRDSFTDPDWFGTRVAGAQFTSLTSQVSRKDLLS